jgi:hypothetical protein
MFATVFSLPMVQSYLSTHIVISKMLVAAGRGCCFTPGSFCPIGYHQRAHLMVSSRWCCCDDVARCLNPLLGLSAKATSGESPGIIH